MKNIHILPTDKPSRLAKFVNKLLLDSKLETVNRFQHIYITSDGKFNIDEWVTDGVEIIKATPKLINAQGFVNRRDWKKIILTTDQDLIKDGVQSINDEFLEWFVKNPSCDFVEIDKKQLDSHFEFFEYKIIISKEEPTMVDKLKEYFKNTPKERVQKDWEESCKATEGINSLTVDELIEAQKSFNKQKTLEEAAKDTTQKYINEREKQTAYLEFIAGVKWQEKRMYSEEEVYVLLIRLASDLTFSEHKEFINAKEWFEQFKKK